MTYPREIEDLERRLEKATPSPPPPPESLLATLKEDIPRDLAAAARPARPARRRLGRRWQAAAATLLVGVAGLVIADRVRQRVPLTAGEAVAVEPATPVDPGTLPVEPSSDSSIVRAPFPVPDPTPMRDDDSAAAADPAAADAAESRGPEAPALADRETLSERRGELEEMQRLPSQALESERSEPSPTRPEADGAAETGADGRGSATPKTVVRLGAPTAGGRPAQDRVQPRASLPDPAAPAEAPRVVPPSPPASPPAPEVSSQRPRVVDYLGSAGEAAAPSTGGSAEPNDAPYGDMFFDSVGVNPPVDPEDDRFSTFGLDVDTGSYTMIRSYLDRGHLPPPEAVRVEELVNFFSYGDAAPRRGDFALSAQGAPTPFATGPRYQVVRFGVHGRVVDAARRRPAVLTFVVDVSGSMDREDRLGLVRRSLGLLLDQLDRDDRVGLVVYGDRGEVLLEPSGDHEAIARAIDRLRPAGATNAEEGLALGYELARRFFRRGAINRVILCSDGVANVGRTGADSILERIEAAAGEGIELTTVGFGMGNYNDELMERLADRGNGRYAYVDSFQEARRLFVHDLTGTLETIARDAKVQVEFDPSVVRSYRLLGYENRDIADERFRDDSVDAGEIGAGHQVSALYEVKLEADARPRDRVARLSLRYGSVAGGEVEETAVDLAVRDLARSWESAAPGLRLAAVVAEFAEILRHSPLARDGDLGELLRRAQELSPAFAGDSDVAELVGLIGKVERLSRAGEAALP